MISIIITAYKEEKTVGRAIQEFLNQQIKDEYEIIVVCPDKKTKNVVDDYSKKHPNVRHLQDPGEGKPTALNLAFEKAKGDILILSDGDVYVGEGSVNALLKELEKEQVGAVSGRPVSLNPRNTLLGYWSHLLTDLGAHETRLERVKKGEFIVVSGYLFAMKKIFDSIPPNSLSDDAIMSHIIREKGHKISYAPNAKVYVKYPTSFSDWLLQKKRSAGGYLQIKEFFGKVPRMRSFLHEVIYGFYKPLSYPKTFKEFFWTLLLYPARLYLWLLIFIDIRLKRKSFKKVWRPVQTTK